MKKKQENTNVPPALFFIDVIIIAHYVITYILINKNDVDVITFDKSLECILYLAYWSIYKNYY